LFLRSSDIRPRAGAKQNPYFSGTAIKMADSLFSSRLSGAGPKARADVTTAPNRVARMKRHPHTLDSPNPACTVFDLHSEIRKEKFCDVKKKIQIASTV
jgi:hypothetical protein